MLAIVGRRYWAMRKFPAFYRFSFGQDVAHGLFAWQSIDAQVELPKLKPSHHQADQVTVGGTLWQRLGYAADRLPVALLERLA